LQIIIWLGLVVVNSLSVFGQEQEVIIHYQDTSGKAIPGVSITYNGQAGETSSFGHLRILIDRGPLSIVAIKGGFNIRTDNLYILSDTQLVYRMFPNPDFLEEVDIVEPYEYAKFLDRDSLIATVVSAELIESLPASLGEKDVIKTLSLLPGIQTADPISADIAVRGGQTNQNLMLLNNAPILRPTVGNGLYSNFNPIDVERVNFYNGNFPVRYGDRLSSVINVEQIPLNPTGRLGKVKLGLFSATGYLNQPLTDRLALGINFRHSVLSEIQKLFFRNRSDAITELRSYNLRLGYEFSNEWRAELSFTNSKDRLIEYRFDAIVNRDAKLQNGTFNSNGTRLLDLKVENKKGMEVNYYHSTFFRDLTEEQYSQEPPTTTKLVQGYQEHGLLSHYTKRFKNNLKLSLGVENKVQVFQSFNYQYFSGEEVYDDITGPSESLLSTSPYLNFRLNLINNLELSTGLRTHFSQLGIFPQPRILLSYDLGSDHKVQLAYDRMIQPLNYLRDQGFGMPFEIYVNPSAYPVVPTMDSYSLSFSKEIIVNQSRIGLKLDPFYRIYNDVSELKSGFQTRDVVLLSPSGATSNLRSFLDSYTVKSYGLEALITKQQGNLKGWLAYTYNRGKQRQTDRNSWFTATGNITHSLDFLLGYRFSKRDQINLTWQGSSGMVFTKPTYSLSNGTVISDGINNARGKAIHTMSIAYQRDFVFRKKDFMLELGIYNIYNRRNPIYFSYQYRPSNIQPIAVSYYPILPLFSIETSF
jgi:hypothetical protein